MMSARRCSNCSINYPDDYEKYKQCVKCDGKTDSLSNSTPITESELNHLKFERHYADRAVRLAAEAKAEEEKRLADLDAALATVPTLPDPPGSEDLMPVADLKAKQKPESD